MKVYWLSQVFPATEGYPYARASMPVHSRIFTTEALARAYANEFSDLQPHSKWPGHWCKKTAPDVIVLELRTGSLRVD